MGPKRKKGFTLIELLVVIAIIALLLSIVMPALNRAKVYAQRVLCGNNLRQQTLGIMLYADQNDSTTPPPLIDGWLWDMSFWTTNQMSRFAGFDDNKTFFCPGNKVSQYDDARYWQYSWLYPGPFPNKVPLRDESTINPRSYYRVLPYIYMFKKNSMPTTLITGEPAKWISKLSDLKGPGTTIMVMDAVISQGNNTQFSMITAGGIGTLSAGSLTDNTNHLSRQPLGAGSGQIKPEGANISYADGHVTWETFGNTPPDRSFMKHRVTYGMWFWW